MIPAVIAFCPDLGRDIAAIRANVPHATVYSSGLVPKGEDGCLAAHQAIVRLAQSQDWPAVCVLEDDCEFTTHFVLEQWEADARWAERHGYNILTGGCIAAKAPRLVRSGLFAVHHFKSAHCVVYLRSAYPIVLTVGQPLDVSLGKCGAKCVMTYPFVAVQAPGFSGIRKRPVDYRPRYRRYEQELEALACAS